MYPEYDKANPPITVEKEKKNSRLSSCRLTDGFQLMQIRMEDKIL